MNPNDPPVRLALDSPQGPFFHLDDSFIERAVEASRESPRRRMIAPIQRSESAPVQRLLNVMQPDSYVPPHRHPRPQGMETALVLRGRLGAWVFEEDGAIWSVFDCRAGTSRALLDLEPGIWHTFCALEPDTVVLEIKGGPYDRMLDKEFAPWAPLEEDSAAQRYHEKLMASFHHHTGNLNRHP